MKAGADTLFVYGKFTYTDHTGAKRHGSFRYACGGEYNVLPDGGLAYCREGNEYD